MSEEELKAVEELKEFISPDTEIKAISMENIKIIYNLITKQQKEIENSVSKDKIRELRDIDNIDLIQYKLKKLLEE